MAAARVAIVVGAALALLHGRARAGGLAVTWQAPPECPDLAAMRARIAQRTGAALDALADGTVAITVTADASGGYVAEVGLGDDVRTLKSARCDDLADAIAVIVSGVASAAPAHVVEPAVVAAPAAIVVAAPPTPVAPAPVAWRFGARLAVLGGVGVMPSADIGGELVAFAQRGPARLELGGAHWADQSPSAGVTIRQTVAIARAGWQLDTLPLRAWAGVEVGDTRATDITTLATASGSGRWVAAGAGVAVPWRLTRAIALVIAIEELAAIDRAQFASGDGASIYEPRVWSTRAALGLEVGW